MRRVKHLQSRSLITELISHFRVSLPWVWFLKLSTSLLLSMIAKQLNWIHQPIGSASIYHGQSSDQSYWPCAPCPLVTIGEIIVYVQKRINWIFLLLNTHHWHQHSNIYVLFLVTSIGVPSLIVIGWPFFSELWMTTGRQESSVVEDMYCKFGRIHCAFLILLSLDIVFANVVFLNGCGDSIARDIFKDLIDTFAVERSQEVQVS